MTLFYKPTLKDLNERLDIYLSKKIPDISRSQIKKLIDSGNVLLNNLPAKSGSKLKDTDVISVCIPEIRPLDVVPENIPLDILYEDKSIIVVNKPAGMVVHAGSGNTEKTLVNALLYHCKDLSGINGILRPGIVHRLDKDTSGTMVAAKNDNAHKSIARQFKEHTVVKRYIAIVWGIVKDNEGRVDLPIGRHITVRQRMSVKTKKGRRAVTYYKVLRRFNNFTLLEIRIETGRTHQIRVHLSSTHHPVVGDYVYGKKSIPASLHPEVCSAVQGLKRQALHSSVLGFIHPDTCRYIEFASPLPDDMDTVIKTLGKADTK
ncbi:MAG: RluA family pseudouridine synthase [Deltaproteobacteria bacterium]|nr:RluA family pseudouridine synthase [Deltaproteobacteria bacterium]